MTNFFSHKIFNEQIDKITTSLLKMKLKIDLVLLDLNLTSFQFATVLRPKFKQLQMTRKREIRETNTKSNLIKLNATFNNR